MISPAKMKSGIARSEVMNQKALAEILKLEAAKQKIAELTSKQ